MHRRHSPFGTGIPRVATRHFVIFRQFYSIGSTFREYSMQPQDLYSPFVNFLGIQELPSTLSAFTGSSVNFC